MNSNIINPDDRLRSWREVGANRFAPGRFRCIETLAQRAAEQQGEIRRLLENRLQALLDAYARDFAAVMPGLTVSPVELQAAPPESPKPSGLAALVGAMPLPPGYPELAMLDELRNTMARLRAEDQLRRSLRGAPRNAGPINSHSLIHQALSLMQTISPEYLRNFLEQIETFSWLEQLRPSVAPATTSSTPTMTTPIRNSPPRRTSRTRRGIPDK